MANKQVFLGGQGQVSPAWDYDDQLGSEAAARFVDPDTGDELLIFPHGFAKNGVDFPDLTVADDVQQFGQIQVLRFRGMVLVFNSQGDVTVLIPGVPVLLAWQNQPADTAANDPITEAVMTAGQPLSLFLLDADGNRAAGDNTTQVTISLATNPGGLGTLSGTLTLTAIAGSFTFADLSIDVSQPGYSLRATPSTAVLPQDSGLFFIAPQTPSQAVFDQMPTDTLANATIVPPVTVRIVDEQQVLIPTDNTTQVTVSLVAGGGAGTLAGTLTQTAVNGIVTFADLEIDDPNAAGQYQLEATSVGISGSESDPFNIT